MNTATRRLMSIGKAMEFLQSSRKSIEAAAADLGIVPLENRNLIDWYDEDDLERIRIRLRETKGGK